MTTDLHSHTNRCWWNPTEARWVCPPDGVVQDGSAPLADQTLIDVRDMIIVHTALLREFRLAPAAVRRAAPVDRKQAAAVADHLRFLCDLLHHHHEGEDTLLWPKLLERSTAAAASLIADAQAQHESLDVALNSVRDSAEQWAAAPDAARQDHLAARLSVLHDLLAEHLDLEERALLPLAAAVLTEQEWHAIGEAAVAAMTKPALALAFGMFAYEGDPAVLATMLQSAPAVPRLVLPRVAPHLYARRARAVHGTARP